LGEDAGFLVDLLAGSLRQGQRGVSVLLYGPPGTGKTEFARTLAARLNTDLYALGEEDGHGGSPDTRERLGSIQMAQSLLRDHGEALLLIDEAEDVLDSPGASFGLFGFGPVRRQPQTARVFLHRLLEKAPAPMLWVCNHIGGIDSAVLRRFSYVLEVQPPSRRSRQRVWMRSLAQHGYRQCGPLAARCAELPVSPGIAAQAVRSAHLAGRGAEAVEQVARRLGQGVSGKPVPRRDSDATSFSLDLICADQDIADLTERLARLREPRFSICVDGPPGTGKSAWVRHLAERLDMEVRLERASDLLDMYVGGTEAKIARAFARAQAAGELLVFDEADSFLQDRRGAQRSWEVTAVNEMLTWMESHPLPFACTTNLLDAVDPAAMRRFTFKLRFEYLDEARVQAAFRCFFEADWPGSVPLPDRLAPGDFAVVQKRARIEGIEDRVRLAEMLAEECRHKPGRSRGMGFLQSTG
jgi:SpoVK/Ycf46/Vps4 family AAA+-type ATPase